MLDQPFILLVTHPLVFFTSVCALYLLCYVPALVMRKHTPQMPSAEFLASFATPPPVMVTGVSESGNYVQARTQALFEAACALVDTYARKVELAQVTHEIGKYARGRHIPALCSDFDCVPCKALHDEWLAEVTK